MFETFIIQPIFNLLLLLESTLGDFGIAIIVFTLLVRIIMWPLLKKQLKHGKAIRELQPQIKEIREKYKGTGKSQEQSQEMMNLYKEHDISPFSPFGLLLIQLPIFIGLFAALRSIITSPDRIIRLPYDFVASQSKVQEMAASVADKTNQAVSQLENQETVALIQERFGETITADSLASASQAELDVLFNEQLVSTAADGTLTRLVEGPFFEQQLFGFIDLSGQAIGSDGIYIPVLIIAILAGVFQYFQTKQLTASRKDENRKTVRQIMSEAAKEGKEPDQAELSAAMNSKIGAVFAPLIAIISATSPSGLALYFASSGMFGYLQQRTVLKEDLEDMKLVADVTEDKPKTAKSAGKTTSKKSSNAKAKSGKNKNRKSANARKAASSKAKQAKKKGS